MPPPLVVRLVVVAALTVSCGGADERPAAWEYISPALVQPNCATISCHSRAAAVAGLDFSTPQRGYTSLTGLWVWIVDPGGTASNGCRTVAGVVVCQRGFRPLITPFNPAESRLVQLLRAHEAPRMPPDRPLPEVDIALIERWILAGATPCATCPAPMAERGGHDGGTTSDAADAAHPD